MKTLHVELGDKGYDIKAEKGIIKHANEHFDLKRKVLIVTDSGVPAQYAETVCALAENAKILTVDAGEESKSIAGLERVLCAMHEFGMTRKDCAVAVGGGMVGDLTGFASSVYMRGIDFYNIPTTVLSQVDSSIGGKTAINFMGIKNTVGSFYQPKAVLIDTELLTTLPKRQISSGLAEAVKMAATMDEEMFCLFESLSYEEIIDRIEEIIIGSLKIKKSVVEKDERETGLRRVLNFGHTLGHGIEEACQMHGFYHGECVALGMLPMCSEDVRKRLIAIFEKLNLPTVFDGDISAAVDFISHDKKCKSGKLGAIYSDKVGTFTINDVDIDELKRFLLSEHN